MKVEERKKLWGLDEACGQLGEAWLSADWYYYLSPSVSPLKTYTLGHWQLNATLLKQKLIKVVIISIKYVVIIVFTIVCKRKSWYIIKLLM